MVFRCRSDEVFAFSLQSQSSRYDCCIVGFGAAACDDDVSWICFDRCRKNPAGLVDMLPGSSPQSIGAGRIPKIFGKRFLNDRNNFRPHWCGSGMVEINQFVTFFLSLCISNVQNNCSANGIHGFLYCYPFPRRYFLWLLKPVPAISSILQYQLDRKTQRPT